MTFSRYRLVVNTRTEMVNMKARISLPRKWGVGVADEQSQRRVGLRLFFRTSGHAWREQKGMLGGRSKARRHTFSFTNKRIKPAKLLTCSKNRSN